MSELSTRLHLRRKELGLSQEELAQRMGYRSKSSITKLEKGINDLPQSKVEELAAALETTPAYLLGLDGKNARRIYKRDHKNHSSPNSARTESVCAGALGVQLAGDAFYFGKLVQKPTIGDPGRPVTAEDIPLSCRLMTFTSALSLCLFLAIRLMGVLLW